MITKTIIYSFFAILFAVLGLIVYLMTFFFEAHQPEIKFSKFPEALGEKYNFQFLLQDKGTGLKKVSITIRQNEKEIPIFEKTYQRKGWWRGSGVFSDEFKSIINLKEAGLRDGNATITVKVWDYAWKNSGKGNLNELTQNVYIDLIPPRIVPISKPLYLSQAGSGLISFEVNERIRGGYVKVGESQFPIYSNPKKGGNNYISFFALPLGEPLPKEIMVEVEDIAGNKNIYYHRVFVSKRQFKKDTIPLSDNLLNVLVSKLSINHPEIKASTPIEMFQKINSELRPKNDNELLNLSKKSVNEMLWHGKFLMLPNSAYRALFGDQRTYVYGKEKVDYTLHLGIDLASNQNSPVPAANNGIVVFTGYLGIYGDTIVIDHGMGLFSSYSHLSSIKVKKGDKVNKGDIIGLTGTTGLAVGDHLHYSMMLHGNFITPMEWIDEKWITDHIMNQM